jgi:hypothetical protein
VVAGISQYQVAKNNYFHSGKSQTIIITIKELMTIDL